MGDNALKRSKVLVFDANPSRAEALSQRLRFLNYEPVIAGNAPLTDDDGIAVLLGDLPAAGDKGSAGGMARSFQQLTKKRPDLPIIAIIAIPPDVIAPGVVASNPAADALVKAGTRPVWRLDSPLRRSQLKQLLSRAEGYRGKERRQRLTGNSLPIRAVRQSIEQVADFDTNVLVTGESGTGKELVARTIHDLSTRHDRPFVPINCGAIPSDLLESELFGHEKGAFSGAISARTGRFELAEGGTLFLDEIGDMSLPMQVKLLRVLEERSYERVGSNQSRKCNVRIIAATHRDLPAAVAKGEFREDLYYRLNVFPIEMPPLCKRLSDLPLLLDELLYQHQGSQPGRLRVSAAALAALANYNWPGNIRELSNLVERLAILYPSGEIGLNDLPPKYRQSEPISIEDDGASTNESPVDLKGHLQAIEQDLIRQAMQEARGVVATAARLLKMRRTTLVEKLGKYAIA
jgi:sigma-54 dependent transcriptional regulator, flagellar regulatory protein